MKDTIKQELLSHVIDTINDQELTEFDELNFHAFNEDHYIILKMVLSQFDNCTKSST